MKPVRTEKNKCLSRKNGAHITGESQMSVRTSSDKALLINKAEKPTIGTARAESNKPNIQSLNDWRAVRISVFDVSGFALRPRVKKLNMTANKSSGIPGDAVNNHQS